MRRAVLILFVVLFMCSPWALGSPGSLEDEIALQTRKLEELRKEQARLESELKKVLSSAKDLSSELAKLEKQIAAAEADIAKSRERILALEKQRKQLEREVESLQRGILQEKSSQEAIARGAYRVDTGEMVLQSLISGVSPAEWEADVYWAAQCLRAKSSTIEEASRKQRELAGKLEEIKQRIRLEVVLKERLVLENRRLTELRKAREEILRRLEHDRARLEKNRKDLVQAQRNLEATLARLREELARKKAPSPPQVPVKRGRLFWPVSGGTIFRRFGEWKDAHYGITFYNPGIDIACPVGTPVYAAADGVVLLASTIRGYGKTIIIDHGNDLVTVYAHLGEIRVQAGDTVRGGQVIALSGDSGLVERPVVHFEVRVGTSAREEDPLLWLQ